MNPHALPAPRRVPAGRAFDWLAAGWRMFIAQPFEWILVGLGLFVALLVLGLIPLLGQISVVVLLQIMVGGMLYAASRRAHGQRIALRDFFEGFRRHPGNLALVGLIFSVSLIAAAMVLLLGAGGGLLSGLLFGRAVAAGVVAAVAAIAAATFFLLWFLMLLALWFAPALIMFANVAPLEAMRLSLRACLLNIAPMLLLGLIVSVASVLGLAVVLGLLVLLPVVMGAAWTAYAEVFTQPAPPTVIAPDSP